VRATFTDTQEALREAVRDLLGDHATLEKTRAVAVDGPGFDPGLWRRLTAVGANDLPGPVEEGIVAEELGKVVAAVPYAEHQTAVALVAAAEAAHPLLEELRTGESVAVWADDTQLVRVDDRVEGTLRRVPHGRAATHLLAAVGVDDHQRLACIPVADTDAAPLPTMDLTRPLVDLTVSARPEWIGGPFSAPSELVGPHAAVLYAHDLVGVGQRCLELGAGYARTRSQFGRAIGSFQAVSHRLADMFVEIESARSHAYHAAWAVGADEPVAELAASQAKAAASVAAVRCAEGALQVHGGVGFTWEHDLHLYLKRARSSAALHGGASEHRRRMADLMGSWSSAAHA
jgi:alkylation response protein AidB-like acyl-CoA dehydrogenase